MRYETTNTYMDVYTRGNIGEQFTMLTRSCTVVQEQKKMQADVQTRTHTKNTEITKTHRTYQLINKHCCGSPGDARFSPKINTAASFSCVSLHLSL